MSDAILGIVGGIAPPSTIEYYRRLVAGYQALHGGGAPRLLISSINFERMIALVGAGDREGLLAFLAPELRRLADGGAEVGLFASNTPHLYFEDLAAGSPIPLINLVEAVQEAVSARGISRVGLLGTRFTMESGVYTDALRQAGTAVDIPEMAERVRLHAMYMGELAYGRFDPAIRSAFMEVIRRLRRDHGIEGVLLAGTELSLLLPEADLDGLPLFDTTQIHVDRALAELEKRRMA